VARLTASASPHPHPRNSRRHTNARCSASDAAPGRAAPEGAYFVSGAAGFIGSHLVESLLLRGCAVVAVDSMDQGGPYPRDWKEANVALLHRVAAENAARGARLAFHEADAGDSAAVRALFAGGGGAAGMPPVSRVCHLGARSGVRGSVEDPAGAVAANVASTAVLLDLAAAAQCRAFVLASSGSVYGECSVDAAGRPVPSAEGDSTAAPVSPYAATKRAAELMAHGRVVQVDSIKPRVENAYGFSA